MNKTGKKVLNLLGIRKWKSLCFMYTSNALTYNVLEFHTRDIIHLFYKKDKTFF
jgi:hypothetical protein